MKLKIILKTATTGLACLGMLLPVDLMAAQPVSKARTADQSKLSGKTSVDIRRGKVRVIDVELDQAGNLRGKVINAEKESVKQAVISVRTAKKELGRSLSGATGEFTVTNVPAGTFYVVAGSGHGVYRLWKNGTAPRKALKQIRIISDRAVIRAQNDTEGRVLYDEDGTAYGQVRIIDNGGLVGSPSMGAVGSYGGGAGMLDSLGVIDALMVGGVLTGVGFGIANYAKNKDIEDDVNALPRTNN
jgi:hypothetical protein